MGQSASNRRRRNNYNNQYQNYNQDHNHNYNQNPPLTSQPISSSSSLSNPQPLPSETPPSSSSSSTISGFSSQPPSYVFAANAPYPSPPYPRQHPYPAPPYTFYSQYSGGYGMMGRPNYPYGNQSNGSSSSMMMMMPPRAPQPLPPPPPYVDHQKAKKIRNDVNLHKETIRLELDEANPDHHLVSFTFDSTVDGSITIFYFAKEGANCKFSPQYPDMYMPVKVPFQKGIAQKFRQPSGTGIDLGFFELDDLSEPTADIFPLVISAETFSPSLPTNEQLDQLPPTSNAQITQAILEKKDDEPFHVKVVKQILWVDGVRYELHEIYGISNSADSEFEDNDQGKECVICMSEPKDTTVLPCRHMCLCSECAKLLRLQSNRCPICRQPVEQLLEIKMKNGNQ